jgi:hypothetical protein
MLAGVNAYSPDRRQKILGACDQCSERECHGRLSGGDVI